MQLRLNPEDVKFLIDNYISRFDYKSAKRLFDRNINSLKAIFPDWSLSIEKLLSSDPSSKRSLHHSYLKIIADYNLEIEAAEKINDKSRLSRILKDIERKFGRQIIKQEDYIKLRGRIKKILDKDKYTDIFSLINNTANSFKWSEYIRNNERIDFDDIVILNEIFRVSKIRIKEAFDKEKFDAISKYINELFENIKTTNPDFRNKIESFIFSLVESSLYRITSPSDRTIRIEYFYNEKLINDPQKERLLSSNHEYLINLKKKALASLDFIKAKSYGDIPDYDFAPDIKAAVKKLEDKIYYGDASDEILKNAISSNIISHGRISEIKNKAKCDRCNYLKQQLTDILIREPIFFKHLKDILRSPDNYTYDSILSTLEYEPEGVNFINSCKLLIAEAINGQAELVLDDLIDIEKDVDARIAGMSEKIDEYIQRKDKADELRRKQIEYERKQNEAEARKKIAEDRKIGIEPYDWDIIKANDLIVIEDRSDEMSFSFCLDYYTIFSTKIDEGEFNNEYSEFGDLIHKLKYVNYNDEAKRFLIDKELIPKILSKTDGLSLWNKQLIIVPTPFSCRRSLQPVYEIAKSLAREKNLIYSDEILRKTTSIEAKNLEQDEDFSENDFYASYSGKPTSILVIDDTYGTGKTIRACAKALKRNSNIQNVFYLGVCKNRSGGLTNYD